MSRAKGLVWRLGGASGWEATSLQLCPHNGIDYREQRRDVDLSIKLQAGKEQMVG
jgi:hypothetical protein